MIAELYADMGSAELWNRARLAAYMSNGIAPPKVRLRCSPCEGLAELVPCLQDQPPDESGMYPGYNLPELDPAPWYDSRVPESADFAGFLVLDTKLSSATDRRMVQNVGHGATLTRSRFQGRTLEVRGMLIGRTCCATEYGLRWLTQALLGEACTHCDGSVLTFLTCAPSIMEAECLTMFDDDGTRIPYFREESGSEWERGTDFIRQMYGSGLLEGPEVISQRGGGNCGCGGAAMTEVEFTIGLGNPWLYRTEVLVVDEQSLGGCEIETCSIEFNDSPDCDPTSVCPPFNPCDEDPDCTPPPVPPPLGLLPSQQCGCIPLASGRSCASLEAESEWFDQALIIEIYAGETALRNFAIRIWQNPLGLECCDEANESYFSDCSACASLLVGYVPAFGTLRFDSAARSITIECNGRTLPAAKNVGTVEGLPFEWFEVGCQPICLGVDIDCMNTDEFATMTVWQVGREL